MSVINPAKQDGISLATRSAARAAEVLFVYRGEREERLPVIAAGQMPDEFLYGFPEVREAFATTDFMESDHSGRTVRRMFFPFELLTMRLGFGLMMSTVFLNLRAVRQARVIVATTDSTGIPFLILKRLGLLRARVVMISQGLHSLKDERAHLPWAGWLHDFLGGFLGQAVAIRRSFARCRLPDVVTIQFGIDCTFWRPAENPPVGTDEGFVLSVGSDQLRDYPTLIAAVGPVPLRLVTRLPLPAEASRPQYQSPQQSRLARTAQPLPAGVLRRDSRARSAARLRPQRHAAGDGLRQGGHPFPCAGTNAGGRSGAVGGAVTAGRLFWREKICRRVSGIATAAFSRRRRSGGGRCGSAPAVRSRPAGNWRRTSIYGRAFSNTRSFMRSKRRSVDFAGTGIKGRACSVRPMSGNPGRFCGLREETSPVDGARPFAPMSRGICRDHCTRGLIIAGCCMPARSVPFSVLIRDGKLLRCFTKRRPVSHAKRNFRTHPHRTDACH